MRIWSVAVVCLAACVPAAAPAATDPALRPGAVFEIRRDVESASKASDGRSTGSSTDRDTIEERVIAITPAGLELEYDLPKGTRAEDRARQWQFPARVLKPGNGPLRLLNRAELATRAAAWLKAGGMTEAACGHWYFSWSAFRIDCDPEGVMDTIKGFDPGPDGLADGVAYRDPAALAAAPVKRTSSTAQGAVYQLQVAIDPDLVRQEEAKADVAAGEILRQPVTYDQALRARAADAISGTITLTFETDPAGRVWRQTKVTTFDTSRGTDGGPETRTSTQTLERKLIADPGN